MAKKREISLVRSSAAEYLTFVAASGRGGVEAVYADENVWLTQKMMGVLYDVQTHTINYHLKKVFSDSELQEDAVIRKFRITAADRKSYDTQHYSLAAIIAVGYKVNSERAVQFRKWVTGIVEEYAVKGYTMDDERLKNGGSVLTEQYFEEQLQRVREIRLSERKFYQKVTDIYATSIDYDVTAQATQRFFAMVQNKLHWAIHGQTAAEVIYNRADAEKDDMGLTTWKDAPKGKIQKFDVAVAKNYLTEDEMAQLTRLVSAYLDVAEDMALRKIPMTMQDWETRLNRFLAATDRDILQDAGKVSAEIAKAHAESEFERYRIVQDRLFESDFDRALQQLGATALVSDGDKRERTHAVHVLAKPHKKPVARNKGKDKGNKE
ncbi:MAG: cell filamentation protein Fic [Rhodanobacter sp.]|nr:MAG: cell filamentation protein Fic [Rhodanobacter sp.]TAM42292.1 MAG: cell filamentation protein Fic [Rhodanobacter sp.]TAN29043.1 MAG: cell filamentation protein Fic [Rhodanobacter sp.]